MTVPIWLGVRYILLRQIDIAGTTLSGFALCTFSLSLSLVVLCNLLFFIIYYYYFYYFYYYYY